MRIYSSSTCCAVLACAITLAPSIARADLIFFSGNPSGYMPALHDEGIHHDNVMFNRAGLTLEGTTVEGYVNGSDERVSISSSEALSAGGGQAPGVSAQSGSFFDAVFAPHSANDDTLFRSLSFNIDANGNDSGNVALRFYDEAGAELVDQRYEFNVSNGNNFFGVIGDDGMVFSQVAVTSDVALDRIAQIRTTLTGSIIDPPTDPPTDPPGGPPTDPPGTPTTRTPEPASILVWAILSAFAIGFWRRARLK